LGSQSILPFRDRLKHASRTGDLVAPMIALEMLGYMDLTPGSQRYPAGLSYLMRDDPLVSLPAVAA
jgi:hypothetical protein